MLPMSPMMAMGPPPPEMLRYIPVLKLISVGYGIVLVLGLVSGGITVVLNDAFVLLPAVMILLRQEMMMQCVTTLCLFAWMSTFFDLVTLISALTNEPGASNFFASSCTFYKPVKLLRNTTVYYEENHTKFLVPADTKVEAELNLCGSGLVVLHVALLVAIILDITTSVVGWRLLKEQRNPLMDPGLLGGPGPLGGGGGGDFGQPPFGQPPGNRPAGPPGGPGAPQQAGGGFTAFQGGGRTLGS
eukprot:TRINITY_DN44208_c0_g1_i1.p1 TRINITY_DN44208_c0_g1~~TRINITY_DN44208_c0_g1_i1.p1  ORF type:complete len:244 (+),score=41.02 TRINITY_DN44208_c0_g1_i1:103-834(+)